MNGGGEQWGQGPLQRLQKLLQVLELLQGLETQTAQGAVSPAPQVGVPFQGSDVRPLQQDIGAHAETAGSIRGNVPAGDAGQFAALAQLLGGNSGEKPKWDGQLWKLALLLQVLGKQLPAGGQNKELLGQFQTLKQLSSLMQGSGMVGTTQSSSPQNAIEQMQRLQRLRGLLGVSVAPDVGPGQAADPDPEVAARQRRQALEFRIAWLESLIDKAKKEIEQIQVSKAVETSGATEVGNKGVANESG
jgi:hypothetical protein